MHSVANNVTLRAVVNTQSKEVELFGLGQSKPFQAFALYCSIVQYYKSNSVWHGHVTHVRKVFIDAPHAEARCAGDSNLLLFQARPCMPMERILTATLVV